MAKPPLNRHQSLVAAVPNLPRDPEAAAVVAALNLSPHPEGGWYRETWRAPPPPGLTRGWATAILFLLEGGGASRWHRIDAAELWLFQSGGPLRLRTASGDQQGPLIERRLGPNLLGGDALQHLVRPHHWQDALALETWSLAACVVAPAFEFSGFEIAPDGFDLTAASGDAQRSCGSEAL